MVPSMQPSLCPPKCAPNFGQTAFRDSHDLNNSIQESFTRTQCLLKETLPSACVLKHRDAAAMFIQIYISANATGDAIFIAKVGLTAFLCNLTFSVN